MESQDNEKLIKVAFAVLTAILKICTLIYVGVRLEKSEMLNAQKRKCLSALAMDICLPCLLFSAVLPEADGQLLVEGWELLLWPFIYATVSALLGVLCCMAVGIPKQHLGAAAACAGFPNVNGFPVSVVSALGSAIPASETGYSAIVFLSIIQLTDGLLKYTLGPAIFRRDRRARNLSSSHDMPLGHSLHSIQDIDVAQNIDNDKTDWGLSHDQVSCVEPEWSRFDSYHVFQERASRIMNQDAKCSPLLQREKFQESRPGRLESWSLSMPSLTDFQDILRQIMPPQVSAVLLALAIGLGPAWAKGLLIPANEESFAALGFIYGVAEELGNGFVPLQMISLGGRMLNVVGDNGPLASKPDNKQNRSKLLRISGAVGLARMVLAPIVLYFVAYAIDIHYFHPRGQRRPLAFWAPALIVAAMPTANNMSTMADLIGSGRSIAAATTAMQLMAAPVVLVASLSVLLSAAEDLST